MPINFDPIPDAPTTTDAILNSTAETLAKRIVQTEVEVVRLMTDGRSESDAMVQELLRSHSLLSEKYDAALAGIDEQIVHEAAQELGRSRLGTEGERESLDRAAVTVLTRRIAA